MIPNKNPKEFVDTFGEWWYLREFDYLPEPLELYNRNITLEFMLEAKQGTFDLFKTKEEAIIASLLIRLQRGMVSEIDVERAKKYLNI